ncbi:MAG: DNA mismatch repair endonuclease MutL [Dehalococcoidales bacterium]|nr:MAG: DNA mismatch repair endonuclease MutL [Dehalococcoidales bacterium]
MPIKVLDKTVASQIAAGEVVERPASVVKELVENSLDAGASQISVEARGGGVSLIRVTDDGSGIPPAEVEVAFSRYATSKVGSIADLESITTFGFRGEALPSIAAVAEVEIVSAADPGVAGASLSLNNGTVINRGRQARPQGTTISVRNLFRAVPARLKFLKSTNTENSHIARVVSEYALACPEVRFSLTVDGRAVLSTPGSGTLLDTVIEVYGLEVARNLLEVKAVDEFWQDDAVSAPLVTGMIGSPALNRGNRDYLNFFVNRRSINSRLLSWAVEEAYHGLLMQGRHPVAIINITIPPDEVDVNIHPTKAEVKFRHERAVFVAVQRAVRGTLVELAPAPRIDEPTTTYAAPPSPVGQLWATPGQKSDPTAESPVIEPLPLVSLPALRVLGQIDSTYVVTEGPDGLYLIDQHAAHERVLYEKFREQQLQQQIDIQGLLEPVPFEVSPQQDEVLRTSHQQLAESGFSIEPFGDRTYLLRAIPALLDRKDWPAMVRELLDNAVEGKVTDWADRIAVTLACHSAVRAGKSLTHEEMRELIQQLEQTRMPRTCPHGRPTVIYLSSRQLEKEFHRI